MRTLNDTLPFGCCVEFALGRKDLAKIRSDGESSTRMWAMRVIERLALLPWYWRIGAIVSAVGFAAAIARATNADVSQAALLLLGSVVFASTGGRRSGLFGAVLAALVLNQRSRRPYGLCALAPVTTPSRY